MSKVRLREAAQAEENGRAPASGVSLKPLRVAGIIVSKADLVEAIRAAYVPQLYDIEVTEDGQQFLLLLGEGVKSDDPPAK